MTSSVCRCARSWEIEAVRDGRLRDHDAESLARHLVTCAACQHEQRSLAELARDFERLPAPRLDVLAGRRIRQRMLAEHNAWLLRHERTSGLPGRRVWLFAAALAVLLAAGVWRFAGRPGAEQALRGAPSPSVEVTATPGARWSRRTAPHDVRITLEAGELKLAIRRDPVRDHVLIVLPDGEIEDYGTVLSVAVRDGSTDAVRVEQGRVALRLHGHAPLTLAAGQAFGRDRSVPETPTPIASAPAPVSTLAAAPPPSAPLASGHRRAVTAAVHQGGEARPRPSAEAPVPSASNGAGGAALAEDTAYLQLVELVREGRLEPARAAARDYLLRFPTGFRRVEVLDIATHDAP